MDARTPVVSLSLQNVSTAVGHTTPWSVVFLLLFTLYIRNLFGSLIVVLQFCWPQPPRWTPSAGGSTVTRIRPATGATYSGPAGGSGLGAAATDCWANRKNVATDPVRSLTADRFDFEMTDQPRTILILLRPTPSTQNKYFYQ